MWYFAYQVLELFILFQGILTWWILVIMLSGCRNFCFSLNFFLSFFQFSYHKDKFLISSKTSSKFHVNFQEKYLFKVFLHLNLFPKNLNAFKVNNNNNIQGSEIPFSKSSCFEKRYNWLVSVWHKFLMKSV